jgi:hypothetical protein
MRTKRSENKREELAKFIKNNSADEAIEGKIGRLKAVNRYLT